MLQWRRSESWCPDLTGVQDGVWAFACRRHNDYLHRTALVNRCFVMQTHAKDVLLGPTWDNQLNATLGSPRSNFPKWSVWKVSSRTRSRTRSRRPMRVGLVHNYSIGKSIFFLHLAVSCSVLISFRSEDNLSTNFGHWCQKHTHTNSISFQIVFNGY